MCEQEKQPQQRVGRKDMTEKKDGRNESTFLQNTPRLPKVHCFLEDSQVSPVRPSGKSNI
jgi:hypothetical protein